MWLTLALAGVSSLGCRSARCSLYGASGLACGCLLLSGCLLVVLVVCGICVGVGIGCGVGGLLCGLLLLGLLWLLLCQERRKISSLILL